MPNIALLVETSNHFAREVLHGVRAYIREHTAWSISLDETSRGDAPPAWLKSWSGHGIIARVESAKVARAVRELGVPTVDVSAHGLLPEAPSVHTDDRMIAEMALHHLVERGFRRVAYCRVRGRAWSERRWMHFRAMARERGLECTASPSLSIRGIVGASQRDVTRMEQWILSLPRPIGLMAAWDGAASQILETCRRCGILVPEDVAVIGVDNDELLCDLAEPSLSSIDSAPFRVGRKAASLLHRMLAGRPTPEGSYVVEPARVAARASTDAVAVDDRDVARALRFIRENACRGISVKSVVEAAGLSRRSLETRFKELLGRSPREYIQQVQIHRVKELLSETELAQTRIAELCGFKHVEYMSTVFKKKTSLSPSAYRATMRH